MSNRRLPRVAVVGLLATLASCGGGLGRTPTAPPSSPARASIPPRNGLEVIGAMRRAHPSRELRSLSFTISTTEYRDDSSRVVLSRAHAALPGKFRVTRLPTSTRSGFVRDRHRLAIFERGRRIGALTRVDLTILLAYDVFAQSIDTTIMWLDTARIRFALARRDELDGRRVWVVGAMDGDTTSSQFWIDAERWRVLRVIQRDPRSPGDVVDVRFTEFTELLGVPVPTRNAVYRNGALVQTQFVSDVAVNPSLPSRAFDLSRWRDVRGGN